MSDFVNGSMTHDMRDRLRLDQAADKRQLRELLRQRCEIRAVEPKKSYYDGRYTPEQFTQVRRLENEINRLRARVGSTAKLLPPVQKKFFRRDDS